MIREINSEKDKTWEGHYQIFLVAGYAILLIKEEMNKVALHQKGRLCYIYPPHITAWTWKPIFIQTEIRGNLF